MVHASETSQRQIAELIRILDGEGAAPPILPTPSPADAPKRNPLPTSRPPMTEVPSLSMIPPTEEKPDYPPVVLVLKHLDTQTAAQLATQCLDVVPRNGNGFGGNPNNAVISPQIQIVQHTNSLVLFKVKPTEVARIEKLLQVLDVPAKNGPRSQGAGGWVVPSEDVSQPVPPRNSGYPVYPDVDRLPPPPPVYDDLPTPSKIPPQQVIPSSNTPVSPTVEAPKSAPAKKAPTKGKPKPPVRNWDS